MHIVFVLSDPTRKMSGGYKMVYYYANALVEAGHTVDIIYKKYTKRSNRFLDFADSIVRIYFTITEPRWFALNSKIKKKFTIRLKKKYFEPVDVVIATTVDTIYDINECIPEGKEVVYFIQDFENWGREDSYVYHSYQSDSKKVVVSKWLKEIVDRFSIGESIYIPNGIDLDVFSLTSCDSIEKRNRYTVSMLYHVQERKNTKLALDVLYEVKKHIPELSVNIFGTPERPDDLPEWFRYTQNATAEQLRDIYNDSSIFLCTSNVEGYGLTGIEAMACGCALVTTNCQGVLEYAVDGKNALICQIKDKNGLVDAVLTLMTDVSLRTSLAHYGCKAAQNYSIKDAKERFISLIEGVTQK